MYTHGLRLAFFFVGLFGLLGLAAGCAGFSPAPSTAAAGPPDTHDSRVIPASATEPIAASRPGPAATANSEEEDDGFELADLAPENVWKNIRQATGFGPDEGVARQLFEQGKALYGQKKYSPAAGKFSAAAGRWPDSVLEEDALFMLGQCYFFADRYPQAQDAYNNLLKKYDNSRHLDTVAKQLFAIGQYWERMDEKDQHWPITPNLTEKEQPWFDTFGNAIKCYETIRMKDPTGPLADDAIMAMGSAYFREGRYEEAAYHYDTLINEFSNSEHQAQAHTLAVQSKLRVYQGSRYDGTPLDQADKLANQALTQFPGELGQQRQRVLETREQITEQKARREWDRAQYYDKNRHYGAARIHYRALIEEHPLSQAARGARLRLEEIRDLPDSPPNRFRWLTDVFEPKQSRIRKPPVSASLRRITNGIFQTGP